MKKSLFIFSLFLTAQYSFSQASKTVKIDSLVTVTLPAVYFEKDTLGQQTFTAKSTFGFIVVERIPNGQNNVPLKKEKDLKKAAKGYVKEVLQVSGGNVLSERDTILGTLNAHLFTIKTEDDNGDIQFREFLFLYTRYASYSFQYLYKDAQSELVGDEVKSFYGSIKLNPDLQNDDQYLSPTGKGLSVSMQVWLYGGGGFILIVILLFVIIRGRKRKNRAE